MQRFRRSRSESKKRKEHDKASSNSRASSTISRTASSSSRNSQDEDGSTGSGTGGGGGRVQSGGMSRSTSTTSSLLLPEPEEFRTSLILPHLTARFELLRGTDGQLVDYETLTSHLDEQRKTGRLTTFEMDAVLQQYKLQSAFEANQYPLPTKSSQSAIKKKRIDWSGVDLEKMAAEGSGGGAKGNRSIPSVSISTSPFQQQSQHGSAAFLSPVMSGSAGSPTSSRNSFVSFLPSPETFQTPLFPTTSVSSPTLEPIASSSSSSSPSSSANSNFCSPTSPNQQQQSYMPRRGEGSSLFGGRVSSGGAGMVKSMSQNSIASSIGSTGTRKRRGLRTASEEDQELTADRKGKGKEKELDQDEEPQESSAAFTTAQPPNLTSSQIKRISIALDSLQDELSRTLSTTSKGLSIREREGGGEAIEEGQNEEEEIDSTLFDDSISPISPIDQDDLRGVGTFESETGHDERAPSPPLSDTEPIDPFYSSASSALASIPHHQLPLASQIPLPPSSSISSLAAIDPQPRPLSPPTTTLAIVPPPSISQSDQTADEEPSHDSQRQRQYTSETDTTETPSTPNGTTLFPRAFSFPFVPNRDVPASFEVESRQEEDRQHLDSDDPVIVTDLKEEDRTTSASTSETKDRDEKEEEEEEEEEEDAADGGNLTTLAASIPLPVESSATDTESLSTQSAQPRDSVFSVASSTGSSFHEALEIGGSMTSDGSDDEIQLPEKAVDIRESKLLDELPTPLPRSKPSVSLSTSSLSTSTRHPFVDSSSIVEERSELETDSPFSQLDRLPSQELLAIAANQENVAEKGAQDIALEDLVVIQEALVRRAEERKRTELASTNGDNLDVEDDEALEETNEGDQEVESEHSLERDLSEDEDEAVESIREEDLEKLRRGSFDGEEDDSDGDGARSSIGTGMGSRKDSAESGITSTGAFDFGDELSGLGFTSLAPSAIHDQARASRRISKRNDLADARTTIDTNVSGPQSTKMELQTSQSSSSPEFATSIITPSTNQSDAFEFGSLAGSPDTASWGERRDEPDFSDGHEEEEEEEVEEVEEGEDADVEEPFSPEIGVSRSPGMHDLSIEHEDGDDLVDEDNQLEAEDHVSELLPSQTNESTSEESPSTSLGTPVQLDNEKEPALLRVPRNMPRRDPASTTSMLIRDVRNQATLATFALKKTPNSPPSRSLTKKSIRKVSISSPHLVSAPADIATVPIMPSPNLGTNASPSARSPRTNSKISKSGKNRKDVAENEGSKSRGLGSRFKMLLKKQSRDHLTLNGDEVTPFVDRPSVEVSRPVVDAPPVTPPNQHAAQFSSTPGSATVSDYPSTPTDDPTTPLARPHPGSTIRSPPRRPPPPSLDVVEEVGERPASPPPVPVPSESSLRSTVPPSPVPSSLSGREGRSGLNRFVSRLRKSPVPPSPRRDSDTPERSQAPSSKTSLDAAEEQTGFGLGIENGGSRSSPRTGTRSPSIHDDTRFPPTVSSTAPLSVGRNSQASLALQQGFSFPSDSSPSVVTRSSRGGESITRTSGHPVRASSDSMQRLWEAAEDLGLPPDKVQELVDSAYAQSPTTSHGHSGSVSSSLGNRSISTNSPRRQRSNASQARRTGSMSSHARHTSDVSSSSASRGHRRKGSTASSRSLQDRVPTPPPSSRHHRKASLASSREAGPIPERPISSALPPSSSAGSRLSVVGSQYPPPASPSLGSIMSSRQSGYADSFLDFYAQASDDYESDIPPVPPLAQHQHASDRSLLENSEEFGDRTLQPEGAAEGEQQDEIGGEVVWQVLSDLRNNRLSTISKDSSFGFDSRDSSFEVEHGASDGSTSNDRAESIADMLRHRDRKRSSASMPPFQAGRFPSIYVRDEQKLLALGQDGGVATEQQGHFFVRPKEAKPAQPPPLPAEYRQLIASASSRPIPEDDQS
ncbi:uncharacterized protein JCM6883_004256 [Sporobolomyces salmoneus]|uniref:uncharacterized protein n=1 Tax=Sporobolomyces salmoneus TaxID=183962 RepID=UPI0031791E08